MEKNMAIKIECTLRRSKSSKVFNTLRGIAPKLQNIQEITVAENAPQFYREAEWQVFKRGSISDVKDMLKIDAMGSFTKVWRKTATLGGCGKIYVKV